jgi:hypothetical protein
MSRSELVDLIDRTFLTKKPAVRALRAVVREQTKQSIRGIKLDATTRLRLHPSVIRRGVAASQLLLQWPAPTIPKWQGASRSAGIASRSGGAWAASASWTRAGNPWVPGFISAQEAGETGPERLEDLLKEYATYDRRHRAWARIESSLAACSPPDDFDACLPPLPAPTV